MHAFLFRLIYKSSYVLRSVLVDWMYQKMRNVCIESFFNVQCNNTLFVFVFVMPNQKLDFIFFESFIYNKHGCFFRFTSFNSDSGIFH